MGGGWIRVCFFKSGPDPEALPDTTHTTDLLEVPVEGVAARQEAAVLLLAPVRPQLCI